MSSRASSLSSEWNGVSDLTNKNLRPRVLTEHLLTTKFLVDMSTTKAPALTPLELEIMKVVWQKDQATVREVHEVLRERRSVAYTTVMTMMGVLATKGHLKRERTTDRAYTYRPTRPASVAIKSMVADFIDRVFDGAAQPLLVQLVKDRRLTRKELEDLARQIEEA
jgi:BlaI family transcriptional regulator, penicillinase repressor